MGRRKEREVGERAGGGGGEAESVTESFNRQKIPAERESESQEDDVRGRRRKARLLAQRAASRSDINISREFELWKF